MAGAALLRDIHGAELLSYGERDAAADRLAASLAAGGVREGDVVAALLPPGPSFAVAMAACWRACAVFAPISPQLAAGAAIATGAVTWISVVPPLLALLAAAAARVPVHGRLRFIRTASAPLAVALARRAEAVFGCPVGEAYGMTETSHQAAANPPDLGGRQLGTVGRGTGTEWRMAGEEVAGGRLLEVRGPCLFRGYLGAPALTAAAMTDDGWHHKLDVGTIGADGFIRLLGRRSELINRGGYKVAPGEVEETVAEHPGVAACLATAVPHPVLGEEIGLLVVPAPGVQLDIGELRRHCAERLADYKRPGVVRVVDSLPRLATGKASRALASRLLTS